MVDFRRATVVLFGTKLLKEQNDYRYMLKIGGVGSLVTRMVPDYHI